MKITKYEIDMLEVGAADAFLLHFWDDETKYEYVILIDAGNYEDGKKVAKFIREHYNQQYIDLAISTHCDKDHFGGLVYLLQQQRDNGVDNMNIKEIWIPDPAQHITTGQIKWKTKEGTKNVKARSVYDMDDDENLLDLIDGISWFQPFSDAPNWNGNVKNDYKGVLKVLGPTVDYYRSLVPDFRNDLQPKVQDSNETQDQEAELRNGKAYSQVLEDANDDQSSHNASSVIFQLQSYDGKKFLFMGDSCRASIDNIDQTIIDDLKDIYWLKVPHHGSKHNMDSEMINHFHPKVAFISTEKYGHYLSKAIVNTLKKVGARVYSTSENGSMCHHCNTETHKGYTKSTPL